ncbi:orotate phosphoribosyltransferase [Ornithinimicrobium sp. W1665]|uniref:orotate phosphoribosyltransferase n=1 Tax=Ornithinimicrobium sp. W1665 TaxID=3416666 RepID=UPI003CF33A73
MRHELIEFPKRDGLPMGGLCSEVGRDIVAASYRRGDFVLPSGEHSKFYFDTYLFETKPTILRRIADRIAMELPSRVDRVAGTDGGGVALATAVSLATGLPFVIIRPTKEFQVRGELYKGERVAVLTDVVDSGEHATAAATRVSAAGAEVVVVISVIDRDAGAPRRLRSAGLQYRSLYRLQDLGIDEEQWNG